MEIKQQIGKNINSKRKKLPIYIYTMPLLPPLQIPMYVNDMHIFFFQHGVYVLHKT